MATICLWKTNVRGWDYHITVLARINPRMGHSNRHWKLGNREYYRNWFTVDEKF
jgi:hypothetical protein